MGRKKKVVQEEIVMEDLAQAEPVPVNADLSIPPVRPDERDFLLAMLHSINSAMADLRTAINLAALTDGSATDESSE